MFSMSPCDSTETHNQLLSREEQCAVTSVTPPGTAATNLVLPGHEIKGTYLNWNFDDNEEFYFIPLVELKTVLSKLENLDVTVEAQKAEAMALINQLIATSRTVNVTKNSRFPLNGHYHSTGCQFSSKFHRSSLQKLYDCLENIDSNCAGVDYKHSKDAIYNVFTQIVKDKGCIEAYDYALNHFAFPIKSPQSRLDKYLKLLCCFVNMDKDCSICWFEVYNVVTFEIEYGLTWRDDEL